MTYDVIALTRRFPDHRMILDGLLAAGEALRLDETGNGGVLRLCDDNGDPLVWIETPILIHTPGETERLLGVETEVPVWWVEARARPEGSRFARTVAEAVADHGDGVVWCSE